MSERKPRQHEHQELLPSPEQHERLAAHAEHQKQQVEQASQQHRELADKARHHVHEQASSQHNALDLLANAEEALTFTPAGISKDLKQLTLQRELRAIRRKLTPGERRLSKVIHQPVVRVVSEVAGQTVSRPSGLLGGGLVAFLGSLSYLLMAKHIGFKYNYFVWFVLLAAGFVLGVVLEFAVYLATRSRRLHD